MTTICVFGYYGNKNLGDDLFQLVLSNWLSSSPNTSVSFVDPINLGQLPKCDIVIIGGGDLVNDYFMTKIKALLKDTTVPVWGFGIGFPYPQLISAEYLAPFHYIVTRTKSAMPALQKIMPGRVVYTDDLVLSLQTGLKKSFSNKAKNIGIFLAGTICPTNSGPIFHKITTFLKEIASIPYPGFKYTKLYNLYLYSMDSQNDLSLSAAVYNNLIQNDLPNIHLIKEPISSENAANLFRNFYATICTRFHAHILSICAGVPFLSLYSSFKVEDLLTTTGLDAYAEKMIVNPIDLVPTDFNETSLENKFSTLMKNYNAVRDVIIEYRDSNNTGATRALLNNLLFYRPANPLPAIISKVGKYLRTKKVDEYPITSENAHFVAQVVTFAIHRTENASYTWGLEHNLVPRTKVD